MLVPKLIPKRGPVLFKGVGVILLLMAAYLAVQAFLLALPNNAGLRAEVFALVAVFLALTVRVLQAERHHRNDRAG